AVSRHPFQNRSDNGYTLPAREDSHQDARLAKVSGFSLHAWVFAQAHQRRKLAESRTTKNIFSIIEGKFMDVANWPRAGRVGAKPKPAELLRR
ncbi:MAG: hypothetical protein OEQ39_09860, partial [Gammaproteobacteria bacterium]|nr:hypothetical protein [Gammaproteobacteria bacterium]